MPSSAVVCFPGSLELNCFVVVKAGRSKQSKPAKHLCFIARRTGLMLAYFAYVYFCLLLST